MGANVAIFFNVYVCILLASFAAKDALEEESLRHQKKRKKKESDQKLARFNIHNRFTNGGFSAPSAIVFFLNHLITTTNEQCPRRPSLLHVRR